MAIVDTEEVARRNRTVAIVRGAKAGTFNPRFPDWLLVNWSIWREFCDAADKVRAKGFNGYSAYVVVNVLRWQADVRGIKFSMSNTLIPDLARLYNMRVRDAFFTTSSRFGKELASE